jgi:hypothetical protein
LQVLGVADKVEIDHPLGVGRVPLAEVGESHAGGDPDQHPVNRRDDQLQAAAGCGHVADVIGPEQRVQREPELSGDIRKCVAGLHCVGDDVASGRTVRGRDLGLDDHPASRHRDAVDLAQPHR